MEHIIKPAPKNYQELTDMLVQNPALSPQATQIDCQLMISRLVLEEALMEENPAMLDVLHVIHRSLEMLKMLHGVEGTPTELPVYEKNIDDECGYLQGYLNPENNHANASHLIEVLEGLSKKCDNLKELTVSHEKKPDSKRFFDRKLAEDYLDTLKKYAQRPTIHALIKGGQEALLASDYQKKNKLQKV